MDPVTVATTIGTIFLTEALKKSGANIGDALSKKAGQAIAKIREHSPDTAKVLEAGDPTVLNLGKAVLEEIPPDPIFAELVAAADAEENQEFKEKFQAVKAGGTITIIGKQIAVSQTGTNNTQNNTFTL
ncbi:hypothetical protein V2H45_21465 [Tumidithrix elongata RA019]|uniref:Uncharacterized protein n=1 Tax=Tumidithrix elongata BACA0141 TaxID=2716417 RepID=A0AAW9Q9X7_9CYAN|nr:hypothetical protein [Tumidithrix elongata RA019]